MKLDPSRLKRQKEIAKRWWEAGGVGSFLAATGFGKTYTALITIDAMRRKFPDLSIAVAVPSDYLRDQWKTRLASQKIYNVNVDTVHSFVNAGPAQVDMLVLDEMHAYTSPVFSTIFDLLDYRYLLGMTATLRDDTDRNQILHAKCPIFDEVTLAECLKNGWVAPFQIYNYGLTLSEQEMRYYKDLSGKFNKAFGLFGHDLNLAFSCLNDPLVRRRYAKQKGWDPKRLVGTAANMVRNMKERKEFLYHYHGLFTHAKQIIDAHGDNRKIITFSQSTESADRMSELLGDRAMSYHSNLTATEINGEKYTGKALKDKIIELYNDGVIDTLNTAKALDQGVDIEDIDMSLVCSGTSSALQALQRTGRQIRAKEGKRACEINMYIRDTQSEKWLRKRQRKHPRLTINYISDLNEIAL